MQINRNLKEKISANEIKWNIFCHVFQECLVLFGTSVFKRHHRYLVLVCAYLGYATYLGHHNGTMTQSIELIRRLELVQRRATKVILNLPFRTLTTYKQRLISLNLLPTGHLLARIS